MSGVARRTHFGVYALSRKLISPLPTRAGASSGVPIAAAGRIVIDSRQPGRAPLVPLARQRELRTMLGRSWQILKETFADFIEDNALSRAAAIAYYTILSLGPVLVICIAIAGLVFGEEAARGAMVGQLSGLMGQQTAEVAARRAEQR